jgi:hypothetical protein
MSYIFVICYSYCEVKRIAKKKSGGSRNGMMRRAWHKTRDRMELERRRTSQKNDRPSGAWTGIELE